ncbi:hypothetical protein lerEdw1_015518 [Lerista edwardsae]|nr:hypothetical protein lerEdw1_015518 [Lerista edwardsae]
MTLSPKLSCISPSWKNRKGGISQGKLWHCDIDAELQPDSSSPPEADDDSVYSDRTRSPSPELQEVLPDPDRAVGESRGETYPQQGPEQQVELHFTILEESEGGISEGKLCASEVSLDEPLEVDHPLPPNPEHQWNKPVHWSEKPRQPLEVERTSSPAQERLEGEMQGGSDLQVEHHFTIFDDPEEVGLSQGPEDYPTWESPFKPGMYPGDYPKEDWDTSIDSLGDAHPGVPFNPIKANCMPATILDSDNLVTYFWGDEETDAASEPVPTQLIYSGADC